ncbi:hypothetical protein LZ32DRAFT_430821 [Colletotrichum eremochloae]|nr:hypothetical protein LZ32DRAFT_430821 [Colletotrichum eremochloae]
MANPPGPPCRTRPGKEGTSNLNWTAASARCSGSARSVAPGGWIVRPGHLLRGHRHAAHTPPIQPNSTPSVVPFAVPISSLSFPSRVKLSFWDPEIFTSCNSFLRQDRKFAVLNNAQYTGHTDDSEAGILGYLARTHVSRPTTSTGKKASGVGRQRQ